MVFSTRFIAALSLFQIAQLIFAFPNPWGNFFKRVEWHGLSKVYSPDTFYFFVCLTKKHVPETKLELRAQAKRYFTRSFHVDASIKAIETQGLGKQCYNVTAYPGKSPLGLDSKVTFSIYKRYFTSKALRWFRTPLGRSHLVEFTQTHEPNQMASQKALKHEWLKAIEADSLETEGIELLAAEDGISLSNLFMTAVVYGEVDTVCSLLKEGRFSTSEYLFQKAIMYAAQHAKSDLLMGVLDLPKSLVKPKILLDAYHNCRDKNQVCIKVILAKVPQNELIEQIRSDYLEGRDIQDEHIAQQIRTNSIQNGAAILQKDFEDLVDQEAIDGVAAMLFNPYIGPLMDTSSVTEEQLVLLLRASKSLPKQFFDFLFAMKPADGKDNWWKIVIKTIDLNNYSESDNERSIVKGIFREYLKRPKDWILNKHLSLSQLFSVMNDRLTSEVTLAILDDISNVIDRQRDEVEFWQHVKDFVSNAIQSFGGRDSVVRDSDVFLKLQTILKSISMTLSDRQIEEQLRALRPNVEDMLDFLGSINDCDHMWSVVIDSFTDNVDDFDIHIFRHFWITLYHARLTQVGLKLWRPEAIAGLLNYAAKKNWTTNLRILSLVNDQFQVECAPHVLRLLKVCISRNEIYCAANVIRSYSDQLDEQTVKSAFHSFVIEKERPEAIRLLTSVWQPPDAFVKSIIDQAVELQLKAVVKGLCDVYRGLCEEKSFTYLQAGDAQRYAGIVQGNEDFPAVLSRVIDVAPSSTNLNAVVEVMLMHDGHLFSNLPEDTTHRLLIRHPELFSYLSETPLGICESVVNRFVSGKGTFDKNAFTSFLQRLLPHVSQRPLHRAALASILISAKVTDPSIIVNAYWENIFESLHPNSDLNDFWAHLTRLAPWQDKLVITAASMKYAAVHGSAKRFYFIWDTYEMTTSSVVRKEKFARLLDHLAVFVNKQENVVEVLLDFVETKGRQAYISALAYVHADYKNICTARINRLIQSCIEKEATDDCIIRDTFKEEFSGKVKQLFDQKVQSIPDAASLSYILRIVSRAGDVIDCASKLLAFEKIVLSDESQDFVTLMEAWPLEHDEFGKMIDKAIDFKKNNILKTIEEKWAKAMEDSKWRYMKSGDGERYAHILKIIPISKNNFKKDFADLVKTDETRDAHLDGVVKVMQEYEKSVCSGHGPGVYEQIYKNHGEVHTKLKGDLQIAGMATYGWSRFMSCAEKVFRMK